MNLIFAENRKIAVETNATVSHSLFFGLSNGTLFSECPISLKISYCIYEDITKNGNGGCVESLFPILLKVEKCSYKNCALYSHENKYVVGPCIYLASTYDKDGFNLEGVSVSACAPSSPHDQRSIFRASRTDSFISDLNITNSFIMYHFIGVRQYNQTHMKRLVLNRLDARYQGLYFQYASVVVEKLAMSNTTVSRILILQHSNTLAFSDSFFDVPSCEVTLVDSSVTFDGCLFLREAPSSNQTSLIVTNNATGFEFGETIIGAGAIFNEVDKVIRGRMRTRNCLKNVFLNVFTLLKSDK